MQQINDPRLVAFKELLDILDQLRANCPWDKAQTFDSLRYLTIEETYELSDAILDKKYADIPSELGDLLLHIVFYAKIGSEQSLFDITDVLKGINEKLIRRHPHIFSDTKVSDERDVRANWEVIKLKEGNRSVLGGVPVSLPAMVKAYRIQEKASGVGFDWNDSEPAWEKVEEEMQEFKEELSIESDRVEDEFGDMLFALVNYARLTKINPEDALEKTNKRFIRRFQYMEKRAKEMDKSLSEMSLDEMEELWQEAKRSMIND
ncbi:nucleoside triphosphate pyrophosphohydrolase [Bacteroidales bacterium OttesenSCG-928-B11]|nr:nucleoside triphosphate pyrophosphohydrolase [Bacteroidales bacterium OttesenSCG-928-B11]